MIVDEKQNKSKPRRGVMDYVWGISSLRDLMMASAIFYNPAILAGLELRKVRIQSNAVGRDGSLTCANTSCNISSFVRNRDSGGRSFRSKKSTANVS
jgi:hypothetical protein